MHRVAQRREESRLDGDSQMIRGSTFQNRPDEELRTQEVIFPFPTGPISIAEGETKSITMKGVRFSLSMPSIEPVTLNPKVLKVVGELNNGLGSNAFLIHFEDPLPLPFALRAASKSEAIRTRVCDGELSHQVSPPEAAAIKRL
jgi:hypothetical protein